MQTHFERKEDEVPIPHGALPLFIGGGDRFSGEGVQENAPHGLTTNSSLLTPHFFCTPSPLRGPLPL